MSRRVYTSADLKELKKLSRAQPGEQELTDKIISYIPVEVVTAWTVIFGVMTALDSKAVYWAAFIILAILVPIYIWRFTTEPGLSAAKWQILGATGAFIVWVFAMGGPFTQLPGFTYKPEYGTVLLAIYTVMLVILLGKKPTPPQAERDSPEIIED
jgi:hypothetical protein